MNIKEEPQIFYQNFGSNLYGNLERVSHEDRLHIKHQAMKGVEKTSSQLVTFQQISSKQDKKFKNIANDMAAQIQSIDKKGIQQNQFGIIQPKQDQVNRQDQMNINQKEDRCTEKINNLAQISQLLTQLGIKQQKQSESTSDMVKQLKEMMHNHLKKRRNCIDQLDVILHRFQNPSRSFQLQSHTLIQPSLSLELPSSSRYLEN